MTLVELMSTLWQGIVKIIPTFNSHLKENNWNWCVAVAAPFFICGIATHSALYKAGLLFDTTVEQRYVQQTISEYSKGLAKLDPAERYDYGLVRHTNGAMEDRLVVRALISKDLMMNNVVWYYLLPGISLLIISLCGAYMVTRFPSWGGKASRENLFIIICYCDIILTIFLMLDVSK